VNDIISKSPERNRGRVMQQHDEAKYFEERASPLRRNVRKGY
jgi:hypothetical protein